LAHWLWHWALPDMTADRRAALQAAAHAPTVTYAELQLLLRHVPATAAAVAALLPRVAAVGKAVSPTNIEGELTLAEDLASAIRAFLHARGQLDRSDDDGRDARPLPSPLLLPLPLPGTQEDGDKAALFARLHALGPLAVPLSLPQYQVGEQLAYLRLGGVVDFMSRVHGRIMVRTGLCVCVLAPPRVPLTASFPLSSRPLFSYRSRRPGGRARHDARRGVAALRGRHGGARAPGARRRLRGCGQRRGQRRAAGGAYTHIHVPLASFSSCHPCMRVDWHHI
jgi:hypothetical protein